MSRRAAEIYVVSKTSDFLMFGLPAGLFCSHPFCKNRNPERSRHKNSIKSIFEEVRGESCSVICMYAASWVCL